MLEVEVKLIDHHYRSKNYSLNEDAKKTIFFAAERTTNEYWF
jgi:hypothetical protein